MERISAITNLLISAEHLRLPQARTAGGLNNWAIGRENLRFADPRLRRVLDQVAKEPVTKGLHAAKIACACAVLIPGTPRRLRALADTVMAGSTLLLYPRHHYGTDGSDQVSFLVQGLAAIGRAAGHRTRVVDAALWAASAQATLSYVVSGWVKLAGSSWRDGTALEGILRTFTYGDQQAWRLVRKYPTATRVLGIGVLALETTFPLVYVAGGRLARTYIGSAAAFHFANARIMGLGRFVPAFMSMHPALMYTARARRATAGAAPMRSDTFPILLGVVVAAVAGVAGVTNRARSRELAAGYPDTRYFTSIEGNRLGYRLRGLDVDSTDSTAPIFFLENGMVSTAEHWEWIADELSGAGTVLTYNRAGYADSEHRPGTAQTVEDLARDARQLVEHVAGERPVVLVGHSLGGYLNLKAAVGCGARITALVLVDTSHPDELRLSERQARGQQRLTDTFPMVAKSLDLGLGMFMKVPDFLARMPASARAHVDVQYRNSRLWHAGRREWAATLAEFGSDPGLPQVTVPLLVISAERTVEEDEVQGNLHREIADRGPNGIARTVLGAHHDSILTDQTAAQTVADYIKTFCGDLDQVSFRPMATSGTLR